MVEDPPEVQRRLGERGQLKFGNPNPRPTKNEQVVPDLIPVRTHPLKLEPCRRPGRQGLL